MVCGHPPVLFRQRAAMPVLELPRQDSNLRPGDYTLRRLRTTQETSSLSAQETAAETPKRARIAATKPSGTVPGEAKRGAMNGN